MKIGDRVKWIRMRLGLSQAQLAKQLGVTQQSLHNIESNKTVRPKIIPELAKALNVSEVWLQFGTNIDTVKQETYTYLPLFKTKEEIMDWSNHQKKSKDALSVAFPTHDYTPGPRAFAFTLTEEACAYAEGNRLKEGDMIYVDPDETIKNNRILAVSRGNCLTLQRYIKQNEREFLMGVDGESAAYPLTAETHVFGVVVHVLSSYLVD